MKNLTGVSTTFPTQQSIQNTVDLATEATFDTVLQQAANRGQYLYARGVRDYVEIGNATTTWPGGWSVAAGTASWANFGTFDTTLFSLKAGNVIIVRASLWVKMSGAGDTGEVRLTYKEGAGSVTQMGYAGILTASDVYTQFSITGQYTVVADNNVQIALQGRRTVGATFQPTIGSPSSMVIQVLHKFG